VAFNVREACVEGQDARVIVTDIPARLDRLAFTRFHLLIVIALGITWVLDGLEVTVVGSLGAALKLPTGLSLSDAEVGLAGSAYIVGAVLGALIFGDLADRFGRKRLFLVTLGVYLVATILTGFSWNLPSFILFRMLTGAGIGGEYAAINSAIQEFVPARYRGRTDLIVNGSFWVGAALGAAGSLVLLDPAVIPQTYGWRLAFILGGALAGVVLLLRRFVPESPRWLMIKGRIGEAEQIVDGIEARAGASRQEAPQMALNTRAHAGVRVIVRTLIAVYPQRTILCLVLMATQAFCYNAIFFTYALVLSTFYGIAPGSVGLYILPFAAGNFLGPLVLGRLFDTLGRVTMIGGTYAMSGILMLATGALFVANALSAAGQTALWAVTFFFASAGASAAYLTVGECFPLEIRARAISLFYAFGTALGGIIGPVVFGALIGTGSRSQILIGYALGGILMVIGAAAEWSLGIRAERKCLEDIATPLSRTA
jgi:MFS family permease